MHLVLQASKCNAQIPAKIFGSLRAGKPIPGLTDLRGDTAGVLHAIRLNGLAGIDSVDEIAQSLSGLKRDWRQGKISLPRTAAAQPAYRRGRSQTLVSLLEKAVAAQCEAASSPLKS